MLTRNQSKKRKRDKYSSLSENLPPRKKRKKRKKRKRLKKISSGISIINQYLCSLFNENKTEYKEFRKKHKVTITNLNNINVILTKLRGYHNKDYVYLRRSLCEGRKPARWNPVLPREKVPTRAQQLIYIAIGFLQKNNKEIKNYMKKKSKHASKSSKRRAEKFLETHYPERYRYKPRSGRKKVRKTKKIIPVPVLIQNNQDNQNNLYNTSRTSEKKKSFLTIPPPKLSNLTLFGYKPINPFGNNLNLPPVNIPNFNPQNSTPNQEDNLPKSNRFTFLSHKEEQFLNDDFSNPCEPPEFELKLDDLTLDF